MFDGDAVVDHDGYGMFAVVVPQPFGTILKGVDVCDTQSGLVLVPALSGASVNDFVGCDLVHDQKGSVS